MRYIFLFLLMMLFSGCRFGNEQLLYKDNLECYGTNYLGWGNGDYRTFTIGTPEKPFYKSSFKFSIRLPEGTVLKSTEFTEEKILETNGIKTCDPPDFGWLSKTTVYYYPFSTTYPQVGLYQWYFKDSKLVSFDAEAGDPEMRDNANSAYIGTFSGNKFYTMPLTVEQIEEIFGNPDKIEAYWRP